MESMNSTETIAELNITKMYCSDQMKAVASKRLMWAPGYPSCYTRFAARKLKDYFYLWTLAFLEHPDNFSKEAIAAGDVFRSSLGGLKQELTLGDYSQWQELAHSLRKEDMVVIVLDFPCALFLGIFAAMDDFLTPIYAASEAKKISKSEFDDIKNRVEGVLDVFKRSLDEMLHRHQAPERGGK